METERDSQGAYRALIAKEGERGFYRTDWTWGADLTTAQQIATEKNENLGLTEREAMKIQLGTLGGL